MNRSDNDNPTEAPDAISRENGDSDAGFARFAEEMRATTPEEDLAAIDPELLSKAWRRGYLRLGHRGARPFLVEITDLVSSTGTQFQVIEVHCPDMPFIVDTVLGAIRSKGGVIRVLSHPVLKLDVRGWLAETEGPDIGLESYLQAIIEPVGGEAATKDLKAEIEAVLVELERAVADWRQMLERLGRETEKLAALKERVDGDSLENATRFLFWLADDNFTFLGMREYALTGAATGPELVPVPASGLGILRDESLKFLRSGAEYVETTPQHLDFIRGPEPLMVTKANIRARVHRRTHLDYIGIKQFDAGGGASGELRVVGLFTSHALALPNSEIPLIGRKIAEVVRRSGFDPRGHDGKALLSVLENYPRDELFQIDTDLLEEFAHLIAPLTDRPRIRVLPRIDKFDNFVSVLVYLPRDRYDSEIRQRIGTFLAGRYDGRVSAFSPFFTEGELVRVHFIVGRNGGPTPRPSRQELEDAIGAITRNFGDALIAAAPEAAEVAPFRDAFPPGYQAINTPEQALADIANFRRLEQTGDVVIRLDPAPHENGTLKLDFCQLHAPIPLSRRVPLLENFGFIVIEETTHTIVPRNGIGHYLHEMVVRPAVPIAPVPAPAADTLEEALLAVWSGAAENDALNALAISAGLAWHDIAILRALSRYMQQLGLAYSQAYIASVLTEAPQAAAGLVQLFHALFDPLLAGDSEARAQDARKTIGEALERTESLDQERILRLFLNLIEATLRTNRFLRDADGERQPALALKFDSGRIEAMPEPRPYREIFVYSPAVEGVHLRFGPIARGGLRWSDRPEDFRTEVLGLAKAQQVKNAIIVPVGAKGGFVPKLLRKTMPRDEMLAEGTRRYRTFVSSLLDVTDNLLGDAVVPPDAVVRRDGDDPYLVVAADKGTASFSDLANSISAEHGFWLGDAFASGGSAGYDHKKMGITARGAWEAVKRHFREMNRDIQSEPFTVVGVGDMSGDVFGNGMLLSRQIRLIAAFDHRDIFIDPSPDHERSFAERRRLFEMPRSSWQDFDRAVLSTGGGVYSRSLKRIDLSPQAQAAIGLVQPSATPQEVIRAILKADVDLLWFGGIGTYVRAEDETDAEAGDRANEAIRVSGSELRAKVVGEGANLAMTQRGRIEYALSGGRLNTDAIDNSAGVNSSDLEVNIKIALGTLLQAGQMSIDERNALLVEMTDEVAALCLRNNYLQSLALSLAQSEGMGGLPSQWSLIHALEQRGELVRSLEYLPDDVALGERAKSGTPLTRPELAVLLAYAKNSLNRDLRDDAALDDPYLARELFRYFPERLKERHPETITSHRLRRPVIATVLANAMINRGGPGFANEMMAATSANAGQVARAYAAVRDIFGITPLNAAIDALDGKIGGTAQLGLYAEVQGVLVRQTLWFLRNADFAEPLDSLVLRFTKGTDQLRASAALLVPVALAQQMAAKAQELIAFGTPRDLALGLSELMALEYSPGITLISGRNGVAYDEAAQAFFGLQHLFDLAPVIERGRAIAVTDRFDRMALDRAIANLMRAQRDLSADVIAAGTGSMAERLGQWQSRRAGAVDRVKAAMADLLRGELTVSRLSVAAGLLADLAQAS